jgi:hypothetical protein
MARSLAPVPATDVKRAHLELGHWFLEWETPAGSVTAELDSAAGVLYSFVRQRPTVRALRYSSDEARPVAEQWLAKLAPDLRERLRPTGLVPLLRGCYTFTWELMAQGYPVRGDGVTIRIDGHTGDLDAYVRTEHPHGTLVAPAVPPDPEAALKLYRERVGLQLEYRQAFRPGATLEWGLVYRPAYSFPYMDGAGNLFDSAGTPMRLEPAAPPQVVPPVAELPEPPPGMLSAAEAALVAQAALGTTQAPESSRYEEWAGGDGAYGGFFDLAWASGAHATVDAESGLLVWLTANPPAAEGAPVTYGAARATAIEFVRRFRPELAGQLAVTSPADVATTQFQVLKDGIPLNNRFVEVDVDLASGAVTGFRCLPLEVPVERFWFEDSSGNMSAAEAMTAFFKQSPLELAWVTFYRGDGPVTQLLWAPRSDQASEIAAHSGVVMSTGGVPITAPAGPADLAGHPARQAVVLLSLSGIIRETVAFEPEKPAYPMDLNDWLQKATGHETAAPPGVEVNTCIQWPVSRQVFALWAVQAAGYGPVAAMKARIELPFADRSDIGAEYANAAGLLAGVGIIPADRFEPQRAVTRGEAAQIIQGIITHLQEDAAP